MIAMEMYLNLKIINQSNFFIFLNVQLHVVIALNYFSQVLKCPRIDTKITLTFKGFYLIIINHISFLSIMKIAIYLEHGTSGDFSILLRQILSQFFKYL